MQEEFLTRLINEDDDFDTDNVSNWSDDSDDDTDADTDEETPEDASEKNQNVDTPEEDEENDFGETGDE